MIWVFIKKRNLTKYQCSDLLRVVGSVCARPRLPRSSLQEGLNALQKQHLQCCDCDLHCKHTSSSSKGSNPGGDTGKCGIWLLNTSLPEQCGQESRGSWSGWQWSTGPSAQPLRRTKPEGTCTGPAAPALSPVKLEVVPQAAETAETLRQELQMCSV